jgi:NADPH2:quinone reductase
VGATVFTTVGTSEKEEVARQAGAHHVIRYTEQDFVEQVVALAGERPLDVIYDGVGAATFLRGLDLLRPRGTMVLFGQSSGVVEPFDPGILARKGSLYVTRPTLGDYIADRASLQSRADDLFAWIEDGSLRVEIGSRWTLAGAADAHRALEARRTTGKVILQTQ